MQIILSKDECIAIHDALLDKLNELSMRCGWYGVDTVREKYRAKDQKEIEKLIKRFEQYI